MHLFIYGCAVSSLLHVGFLQWQQAGAALPAVVRSFSLQRLVPWNTGSRLAGFSNCDLWAQ